ncbi:hypothetical protein Tco_0836551 [Tanacetum coccineum]
MIFDIDADAEISLLDETQRLDNDLIFDTTVDLGGEEVVVMPTETSVSAALDAEVSAAEPAVTTVSSLVTTDSVTITAAKELTNNDMTMAEALAELKTSKPKVKTTISFISSSKGKAIMIESENPVKIKDLSAHDEQVAKDLHDKIQIDADQELAARMTLKEHETYTVEERARMLVEFIKNRKKQLAVERA